MSKHEKPRDYIEQCTLCNRAEKLLTFNSLEPGDHIQFGSGWFQINMFNRRASLMSHHAIVTGIELVKNDTSAILTIISFKATSFDEGIQLREHSEIISLAHTELYIIRYSVKTREKKQIIEQARRLVKDDIKFNLLWNNCEHFANYCCTGIRKSNQIDSIQNFLKQKSKGAVQSLLGCILRFTNIELDTARVKDVLGNGQEMTILIFVNLLYCIIQHTELVKESKHRQVCAKCCKERQKNIWIKFALCCGKQVSRTLILSFVINIASANGFVGITFLHRIACSYLMSAITNLAEKSLLSTYQTNLKRVNTLKEIWIGDVVSFQRFGQMHDGIVSKVDSDPRYSSRHGSIFVLHYSSPKVFGRRMIVEEEIKVDLKRDLLSIRDYTGYKIHPPEVVLQRAWQRIGETKYGFLSNRSSHFCHWAKIDCEDDVQIQTPHNYIEFDRSFSLQETISPYSQISMDVHRKRDQLVKKIKQTTARIRGDVKIGQIVRLKIYGKYHHGVTTSVDLTHGLPSVLRMSVVCRGPDNVITEESVEVDLNNEDIWIYKGHPVYQYGSDEIVIRARRKVGVRKYGLFEKSFKVSKEIVQKGEHGRIHSFNELQPGDIIVFYYWSLKHAAVVSAIKSTDAETNTIAYVTCIHYALEGLLSIHTVMQETIFFDLNKDIVFLKSYDAFIQYPRAKVVERAMSRVGEQKFSLIDNTSWDLAHWAKVVQKPAIVTKHSKDPSPSTCDTDFKSSQQYLLVPQSGKQFGCFQRLPVRNWDDLKPGIIVELKPFILSLQAILVDSCREEGTITIIHYKPYGYMPMEYITEETISLNMKRDAIWMYLCNPTMANKANVVVRNARKGLQLQQKRFRWGSWDFCTSCVLKNS